MSGPTVASLFAEQVRFAPRRDAIRHTGGTVSYRDLSLRVERLAQALSAAGVRRGERIAVMSENRVEFVELFLASATLGAILACQNWRQSSLELSHCLLLAEPAITFVSPRFETALASAASGSPAIVFGPQYEAWLSTMAKGAPVASAAVDPDDGLIILYTSGTTGLPKGALISQRAVIARSVIARLDGHVFPDTTFVAWTPLYHMGAADYVFGYLLQGGSVTIVDGFDPARIVEIVGQERIGFLPLMPATVDRIIDEMVRTGMQPVGVNVCGAMPDLVPRRQLADVTRLLRAPYRNTFGSTETGAPPASRGLVPIGAAPEHLPKTQSSLSRIRLVDPDDRDVPDGEPGEVLFRGPSLFSGYWRAPDANRECFTDGWFRMGDIMRRNPDGTLDYVDRRKYLIKSGGENIYPAEIERVLLAVPGISDAVVVRRPDPKWGEVPVAFVVRGDADLSSDMVLSACRGRVANYKLPKEICFVAQSDIPRSTTGKVKRHELEQLLAADGAPQADRADRREDA